MTHVGRIAAAPTVLTRQAHAQSRDPDFEDDEDVDFEVPAPKPVIRINPRAPKTGRKTLDVKQKASDELKDGAVVAACNASRRLLGEDTLGDVLAANHPRRPHSRGFSASQPSTPTSRTRNRSTRSG